VQGRDDRNPQGVQQDQQVIAGGAAEDAVFMLDADGLGARLVDAARRPPKVCGRGCFFL
jgi:hypothetical protein